MISHNHKCIFVHIPKCGGQSVEHIFLNDLGLSWTHRSPLLMRPNDDPQVGPPRLAHLTYKQYISSCYISKSLWEQYLSFSIVRNPYSRVESFYKYLGYKGVVSFESFVCRWLPKIFKGEMSWFLMPQYDYISDEEGGIAVNATIKLEELNKKLPGLLAQVGIASVHIPHINKSSSPRKPGAIARIRMLRQGVFEPRIRVKDNIVWTPEARAVVNRLYASDFENLGYHRVVS